MNLKNQKHWQMQDAKARLSRVVREARSSGPQVLTMRGEEVAVLQSVSDYKKRNGSDAAGGPSLVETFLKMPRVAGFKIPERDKNDVVGREPPVLG